MILFKFMHSKSLFSFNKVTNCQLTKTNISFFKTYNIIKLFSVSTKNVRNTNWKKFQFQIYGLKNLRSKYLQTWAVYMNLTFSSNGSRYWSRKYWNSSMHFDIMKAVEDQTFKLHMADCNVLFSLVPVRIQRLNPSFGPKLTLKLPSTPNRHHNQQFFPIWYFPRTMEMCV